MASAEADAEFAAARRRLEPRRELADHDVRQLAPLWSVRHERDTARREEADPPSGPDEHEAAFDDIAADEAALSVPVRDDDAALPSIQAAVNALLKEQNIELPQRGGAYRRLCELVRRAMLEGVRRSRRRLSGDFGENGNDPVFNGVGAGTEPTAPVQPVARKAPTFAEAVALYLTDPARAHLTEKTKLDHAASFRALRELIGPDKPINEITRDGCRRVRDVLVHLPPNATKRWPKLTLEQAADMARAKGIKPLSPKAVNGCYLADLASLFRWAVREEYVERNPAQGLRVSVSGSARDARLPFSTDQLRALFNAPLYTDPNGPPRRAKFWVPLISLCSGMRLGEVLQLTVDDVGEAGGVPVLHVRPDAEGGKRVKTAAGRRVVPVHSELVRLGFLEFVAQQRQAGETRLFPGITAAPGRYLSDPFQKGFGRFLEKAGAAAPRTSFHSFRHDFRDALGEAGVPGDRKRPARTRRSPVPVSTSSSGMSAGT